MRSLRWLVPLVLLPLAVACSEEDSDDDDDDEGDDTAADTGWSGGDDTGGAGGESAADGESTYQTLCVSCHPGSAPDHAEVVPPLSDADIESVVRNGQGYMPAVGAELTEQEMLDLLAYLRATFP